MQYVVVYCCVMMWPECVSEGGYMMDGIVKECVWVLHEMTNDTKIGEFGSSSICKVVEMS